MACEHEAELSLRYDDLPDALRAHLAGCPGCTAAHRALAEVAAMVRAEAAAVAPPTPAEQLAALREVLHAAPLWRRRVAVPLPVLGGALAMLVLVVALLTRAPAVEGRMVIEVVKVAP